MIKTIMFDQGGVLLDYEPRKTLESFGFDKTAVDALETNVFYGDFWVNVDLGVYNFKQAEDFFCERNPKYEKEIRFALKNKITLDFLTVREDVSDFLKQLKGDGYNIFILSNFPKESFEVIEKTFDYFNYVDEKIISGIIGIVKPDAKIYEYVIEKYKIVPQETIFIDDVENNLIVARQFGFNTVLFTNIDEVKEKVGIILNS